MAVDKLVDSTQLDSDLTSVANAIRTKGGTSAQLAFPSGFVSAIQNIPSGGGGSGIEYTPVNCVTVLNNSSVGYNNNFKIPEFLIKDVKKIEANVKFDSSLQHCIWFATININTGATQVPFVDKATGSQITVSAGSTDSDGFTKYTLTYSGSTAAYICFGSWSDATYSHNVSFKTIKGYDASNNVLFELNPCVDADSNACLVSLTRGAIIDSALYTTANAIAGEAV